SGITALTYLDCSGCDLADETVNAALNACDATTAGGYANTGGGTNASSATDSADNVQAMFLNGWTVKTAQGTQVYAATSESLGSWDAEFVDDIGALHTVGKNLFVENPDNLLTLDCHSQSLDGRLDLSACTSLTTLDCSDNADLVSLDVSGCTAL